MQGILSKQLRSIVPFSNPLNPHAERIKRGDTILKPGLYKQVISKNLRLELEKDKDLLKIISAPIDNEEVSKILSKYIEEVIAQGLENIKDSGGELQGQIDLTNRIVKTIV